MALASGIPSQPGTDVVQVSQWFSSLYKWIQRSAQVKAPQTASFSAADGYYYPCDTTAIPILAVSLPLAADVGAGRKYVFQKTDSTTHSVTIATAGGDFFESALVNTSLYAQGEWIEVTSNGINNWYVKHGDGSSGVGVFLRIDGSNSMVGNLNVLSGAYTGLGVTADSNTTLLVKANASIVDAATTSRDLRWYTGTSAAGAGLRWIWRVDATAEGGANAGSNIALLARTDAGAALFNNVLTSNRASGLVGINIAASSLGTGNQNQLQVGGGILSKGTGNLTGVAFTDRTTPSQVYTWYADTGSARLFFASDIFTISSAGAVGAASFAATGAVTGASVAATGAVTGASVAATGAVSGATVAATSTILSSGGGVGYTVGTGGTVTQGAGSGKATAVTLSKLCGTITTDGAALASGAKVSFTVTNTFCSAADFVLLAHDSGGTNGRYELTPNAVSNGNFQITIVNNSTGSLSEALVIKFFILKAAVT